MSDPAGEGVPHTYEAIRINTPSFPSAVPSTVPYAVPVLNMPAAAFLQSVGPPPPMYYIPPTTQTSTVPTVVPQWHLATIIPQNTDPSLPFFQTFLKGKPKALGILVLVAAILEIGLGIALIFTTFNITLPSGIPFWGPVFYIIAGSLTIAAQRRPNICLIKGSLSLNIISSIFSTLAVILNIIDLGTINCRNSYYYSSYGVYYNSYEAQRRCQEKLNGSYAVLALLLVINLLLFCITFSTSIFGCRTLSKVQPATQVFMLQNDVVLAMNPGAIPIPVTTTYTQPPPPPPPAYPGNVYKP